MKIGIITYVRTVTFNYGAELQAYALQYKLNNLGYDTEVVDLKRVLPSGNRFAQTVKKAIVNRYKMQNPVTATIEVFKLILSVLNEKRYTKKYAIVVSDKKDAFKDFFDNDIKHSEKEYRPEDLDTAILPYDTYIAGSDQIWNYRNSDRVDVFFLMFANRFKAKKISYAASFSVSAIPEKYKTDYKKWINNIDCLSVREKDGVDLCRDIAGREAMLVCDPTLLLGQKDWEKIAEPIDNIHGKYVVVYSMSRSKNVLRVANTIAKELGSLPVINIKIGLAPSHIENITDLYNVSPKQWLWLMMNAEYVVTDSFHGTAFSINFNKSFTTIQNPMSELNSRVNTILEITNLKNRLYVNDKTGKLPEQLRIDYTPVNNIISAWRQKSLEFLIKSLNQQ